MRSPAARSPSRRPRIAWIGAALLAACSSVDPSPGTTGTTSAGASSSSGGNPDRCSEPAEPPPLPPGDWCDRIAPGAPGARAIPVDLSAAHASLRFFGPLEAYSGADQALVAALAGPDALSSPDLSAYAAALAGVACAVDAAPPAQMEPASVTSTSAEGVVIVRPGTGPVELPPDTRAVLVDLRDLPAAPTNVALREALYAAVAPALATPVDGPTQSVRKHDGLTDEVYSPQNAYSTTIHKQKGDPIPATGSDDLPLAILTGPRMAPEAAALAGALRLAGRAPRRA